MPFFCEARLCAWIAEPANTWSNVGYFVVAALILRHRFRDGEARVLGLTTLLIGLGSVAYHATGTLLGEILDVAAMYLLSGYLLSLNLARRLGLGESPRRLWLVFIVTLSVSAKIAFPQIGIYLFFTELAAALLLELLLSRTPRRPASYGPFWATMGAFALAMGAWLADVSRGWCDPHNHVFNGHALWHLLAAGSLFLLYGFVRSVRLSPLK